MGFRGLVGQSAIEYLMTYGWMLLVVAVVGGAVFATVNQGSPSSVTGFTGSSVQVDDFGVTSDDDLEMELRSSTGQGATVSAINVTDKENGKYVYKEFSENNSVDVGESVIFDLPNVSQGDSSDNLEVQIFYDTGGLSNLTVSGSISGSLNIIETTEVSDSGGGSSDSEPSGNWSEPVSSTPDCSSYPATYEGSGSEADPYLVMNSSGLQCMNQSKSSYYELGQNINASKTDQWNYNSSIDKYMGFKPVGDFSGTITGNKTIDQLYINRESEKNVGMISRLGSVGYSTEYGYVYNLSVTGANITGKSYVGIIAGRVSAGSIEKSYTSGEVDGNSRVGGIAGYLRGGSDDGLVKKSYALANVNGSDKVGGIAGSYGNINRSFSAGNVDGDTDVGGLVGYYIGLGVVSESYWDVPSSNQDTSPDGTGIGSLSDSSPSSGMVGSDLNQSFENEFDFSSTWEKVDASDSDATTDGYPILQGLSREHQLRAQEIYSE